MKTAKLLLAILLVFASGCSNIGVSIESCEPTIKPTEPVNTLQPVVTYEPTIKPTEPTSTPQTTGGNENILNRVSRRIDSENPDREVFDNEFEFNYDEWDLSPLLLPDSSEWYDASHCKNGEWRVSLSDGNVMVSEFRDFDAFRFDVGDGYFVGINYGEFGGLFTFYPIIGESYEIETGDIYELEIGEIIEIFSIGNVIGTFSIDNDVYLLEGTSHLMYLGYITNVSMNNGRWEAGARIDLNELIDSNRINLNNTCPMAFTFRGDALYLVTGSLILEINKKVATSSELELKILAEHEFMGGLSPNSVVEVSDVLYIGMRGGLLTFDLNNKESKWYVKK